MLGSSFLSRVSIRSAVCSAGQSRGDAAMEPAKWACLLPKNDNSNRRSNRNRIKNHNSSSNSQSSTGSNHHKKTARRVIMVISITVKNSNRYNGRNNHDSSNVTDSNSSNNHNCNRSWEISAAFHIRSPMEGSLSLSACNSL